MKNNKIILIFAFLIIGIFSISCNSSEENREKAGHDDHDDHGEGEEGTVSLTKLQVDAIGLKIVNLESRNIDLGIQVTGTLELRPQDIADISPILGGVIKDIMVIEGDAVKKGQILATMEHPDFIQLQQDYVKSITTLEYIEKEFQRQKELYEEKVGSGKEFQKISSDYKTEKSLAKALRAKLNMLGLNAEKIAEGDIFTVVNIISPLNGIVSLVKTNIGSYVGPFTNIFEVVNNDELHAGIRVFEKDINKIKVGQKVFFKTSSIIGEEFESEIFAISPSFEEKSKSLFVHADILNRHKNLISGMYINGRILVENNLSNVLPEHAIVVDDEKSYIFVKIQGTEQKHEHSENEKEKKHDHDNHNDENDNQGHSEHKEEGWTFKMIEVKTGHTNNGYTVIKLLKPLPKNAKIAGLGAYYLLAEMRKEEAEHSH